MGLVLHENLCILHPLSHLASLQKYTFLYNLFFKNKLYSIFYRSQHKNLPSEKKALSLSVAFSTIL